MDYPTPPNATNPVPNNTTNPFPANITNTESINPQDTKKSGRKFPFIVIILIIIILLTAVAFIFVKWVIPSIKSNSSKNIVTQPSPTPTVSGVIQDNKPYYGEKTITLIDKSGKGYTGQATRIKTETYGSYSVEVDLPEANENIFYQVWISSDDGSYLKAIGKLVLNDQGKFVLNVRRDYEEPPTGTIDEIPNIISITQETTDDTTPENTILQGNFR
jgi:lipopolysaccharide export LptBFGC system permease protein LptF